MPQHHPTQQHAHTHDVISTNKKTLTMLHLYKSTIAELVQPDSVRQSIMACGYGGHVVASPPKLPAPPGWLHVREGYLLHHEPGSFNAYFRGHPPIASGGGLVGQDLAHSRNLDHVAHVTLSLPGHSFPSAPITLLPGHMPGPVSHASARSRPCSSSSGSWGLPLPSSPRQVASASSIMKATTFMFKQRLAVGAVKV